MVRIFLKRHSKVYLPENVYLSAMNFYKLLLRPVLFFFDPEVVHHLVTGTLKILFRIPGFSLISRKFYCINDKRLERDIAGLRFSNPVGVAAGFDKNGELVNELSNLGFGFVEIGTVTPEPQPGNDKPRMFRLRRDQAIINRMGFNNKGSKRIALYLQSRKPNVIVGGNIGKNKITPNEHALSDYEICFRELFDYVDYFVVNVSSPNTPGLRELQEKEPLSLMLGAIQKLNDELSTARGINPRPVFLKISPDLTNTQLDDIIDVVVSAKLSGVIATNTTISRDGLITDDTTVQSMGSGGLSGKPLTQRSTEIIRYISSKSAGRFVIIGVGGIHSPEDALEKIKAGASLVQLYTGFIYEGPSLVKEINRAILDQI